MTPAASTASAPVPAPDAAPHAAVDLLTFAVGGRHLALPAAVVQHIVRAVAVDPLPQATPIPAVVDGVINVRGTVVVVIDVARRFGLPAREVTPDQYFVLAQAGPRLVALRVDQVLDLVRVPSDAIDPVQQAAPGTGHVSGIARVAGGLLLIQDLEQVLSADEASQLEAALRAVLETGREGC